MSGLGGIGRGRSVVGGGGGRSNVSQPTSFGPIKKLGGIGRGMALRPATDYGNVGNQIGRSSFVDGRLAHLYDVEVQYSHSDEQSVKPITSFDEAGLSAQVLSNVKRVCAGRPTPIQQYCIPIVAAGRNLMAISQTGCGKTVAYMLPMIASILQKGDVSTVVGGVQAPAAVVLAPTRELASQICHEGNKLASETMVNVMVVHGGVSVTHQMDRLAKGCSIVVGTPGRLNHLISDGHLSLTKCRFLVIDQADRMLDRGFEPEIMRIVQPANMKSHNGCQTLMISITFPDELQDVARKLLKNNDYAFVSVRISESASIDIKQEVVEVSGAGKNKIELLLEILKNEYGDDHPKKRTLVFVQTKRKAHELAGILSQLYQRTKSMHGDLEQCQRDEALRGFKSGEYPILVATSVACGGLDISGVDHTAVVDIVFLLDFIKPTDLSIDMALLYNTSLHPVRYTRFAALPNFGRSSDDNRSKSYALERFPVISYDLPTNIDDYVHRIGRPCRIGNTGRSTVFFDPRYDTPLADDLLKVLTDAQQTVPAFLEALASDGATLREIDFDCFGKTPAANKVLTDAQQTAVPPFLDALANSGGVASRIDVFTNGDEVWD